MDTAPVYMINAIGRTGELSVLKVCSRRISVITAADTVTAPQAAFGANMETDNAARVHSGKA